MIGALTGWVPRGHRLARARRAAVHLPAVAVLVIGVILTGLLANASAQRYTNAEQALTDLQTKLASAVVSEAAADLQRRMEPAVLLAAQSGDSSLAAEIGHSVGAGGPLVGAALYKLGPGTRLVSKVGAPLEIPRQQVTAAIGRARARRDLAVTRAVGKGFQRLGYALVAAGPAGTYAVFAEQAAPTSQKLIAGPTSPAANLYVAIYFGSHPSRRDLIETNAPHLPLRGIHDFESFPFGGATLSLATAPRKPLVGGFAAAQTTIIAVGGTVITLLVAALVEVLAERRRRAERRASESRKVAEVLQHSLLPSRLPEPRGMQLAARYQPATAGISVGGDWYDAVEAGGKLYFSVGDVAGHGLGAATLMGRLRTAIAAYMADADSPEVILAKLGRLVDGAADGRFATALCGWVDPLSGRLANANAGHLPPLLVCDGRSAVVAGDVGPPIGVGTCYRLNQAQIPPGATLVAYTDGLVERRGETITDGIDRLGDAAVVDLPLDGLLDHLLSELVPAGAGDDVALLALRVDK